MSRALTIFVIATACVTSLTVIGAPWLRFGQRSDQPPYSSNQPRLAKGREFFEKYVRLEHDRDLAMLDLFTENAIVIDRRPSPNGQITDLKIPIVAFRPMLRTLYVVAKAASEPPTVFSQVKHFVEGSGVRIETDCYSPTEEFQRHLSMFVRPDADDEWRIEELIVESPEVRP